MTDVEGDGQRASEVTTSTDSVTDEGVLQVSPEGDVSDATAAALRLLACDRIEGVRARSADWRPAVEALRWLRSEHGPRASTVDLERFVLEAGFVVRGATRRLRWWIDDANQGDGGLSVHVAEVSDLARSARDTQPIELECLARALANARVQRATEHDLRGPLNAISLHLALLKSDVRPDELADASAFETVQELSTEFHRFQAQFSAYMARHRPSSSTGPVFDLCDAVKDALTLLAPVAKQKRATLSARLPATEVLFHGSRSALGHAFVLIADQALESMRERRDLVIELDASAPFLRIAFERANTASTQPIAVADRDAWRSELDQRLERRIVREIVAAAGGASTFAGADTHPTFAACAFLSPTQPR